MGAKTEHLRDEAAALADLLTSRLSSEAQFELVERIELNRVLKEQVLSGARLIEAEKAVQLGKLVKADWLCLPSFQNLDGTNYAFAKIVEVNTAIIRDITSVAIERTNLLATAEALANFLTSSRSYVRKPNDRVFIAFGAFQNFGINNRYGGFGDRLRAAMARRYQGTRIAAVERSQVTPLLNEFRLAAAGLTRSADKPTGIQPAFVVVDGFYQSFQDHESKLNVVLRVEVLGARKLTFTIKELPGDAVENRIAACINTALTNVAVVSVTQREESQLQLRRGMELARFQGPDPRSWPTAMPPTDVLRSRRQPLLKDAISAFESVLLLDPEHVTAKLYLSRCLADPHINQLDRARDFLREVIAATTNATLLKAFKHEFASSYAEVDDSQAIELLAALKAESTNLAEIVTYNRELEGPFRRLGTRLPTQQRMDFAIDSSRMLFRLVQHDASRNGRIDVYGAFRGGSPCWLCFSAVDGDLSEKLVQVENVVSNFVSEFPPLKPYLLSGFVQWRVGSIRYGTEEGIWDVVSPVWKRQYEEVLAECEKGTNRVLLESVFYSDALWPDLEMFFREKELAFAERLVNLLQKNGRQYLKQSLLDQLDLYTGYLLFQQKRWADAAAAFERIGGREVRTSLHEGPWGKGSVASARVAVELCRQRLAGDVSAEKADIIPAPKPVKSFQGKEILFTLEGNRMWVADNLSLVQYNPDTGESKRMALPVTPSEINASAFTSIAFAGGKVWIGTRRNGLIAYDATDRTLTNYTVDTGLLMNQVTALHLYNDRLWIGFGGAVGYYDLQGRRFVGLMGELPAELGEGPGKRASSEFDRRAPAPRSYFQAFAGSPPGPLWATTSWGAVLLFDARSNRWNAATFDCRCQSANLATTGEFLVVPCYEPASYSDKTTQFGGLLIHDLAKGNCKRVAAENGLPNNEIRSVALDGSKAWVGGRGFIGLVDLRGARVEKICQLKTTSRVRSLEIDGDTLWFSAGPGLYRLFKDGQHIEPRPVAASPPAQGELTDESAQLLADLKTARALVRERSEVRRIYGTDETEEYKTLNEKFETQVRKVAHRFPSIALGTSNFFTFILNQTGGQFDGIRFRNDSSEIKNFGWILAFQEPRSLGSWSVLPREPQPLLCWLRGGEPRLMYTNAPWSGRRDVPFQRNQSIRNKSILPGKEYIIWFSFTDTRTNTMQFFCSLFPTNQELGSAELDAAFGLKGHSRYPPPFSTRRSAASDTQ